MIEPEKLSRLEGGQKRRKLALTFGALERDIAGIAEKGMEFNFKNISRAEYTKKITQILLTDPKLPEENKNELELLLKSEPFDERRLCNCARNALLSVIGTFPAEWDLVIAPHENPLKDDGSVKERKFYPGVSVYAEDIRSPFNLGSIFRTAEGMGAENVFISPLCVDPEQPRAVEARWDALKQSATKDFHLKNFPMIFRFSHLKQAELQSKNFNFRKKESA